MEKIAFVPENKLSDQRQNTEESRPQSVLLEMRGIEKSFPGVKALAGVDFTVRKGEVHALMGENGAGKSTLIKVLTGVHPKDAGSIVFNGQTINLRQPSEAPEIGISTVYQEVNLIPFLTVAENICLGREPLKCGTIDWAAIRQRAQAALARLNLDLDVTEQLSAYSIAIQQMVAIARAVDISAQLLILDEPTSSLDRNEVEQLFAVMRKLKAEGLGIVFITHFLDQVYAISDRITVLRNGQLVGEYATAALPQVDLVAAMVGKELTELENTSRVKQRNPNEKASFFKIRGMKKNGTLQPFDLEIRTGEALGLAGLLGSGRTEMVKLIYGIDRADGGGAELDGHSVSLSPRRAIEYRFGYCPEDRKQEGIIPDLSVRENIILALQAKAGWFKCFSRKNQEEIAEQFIKQLNIATPGTEQAVKNLSGGNQQKVILARWLASNPRLLILDEPTRGIDIGTKTEIQKLVLSLCHQGMAIIFISSELDEVVRCSHRVAVLRDRVKIGELLDDQVEAQKIIQTIAGEVTES